MEAYGLPSPECDKTELQKELLRYDKREQQQLYEHLCESHPSTDEQQNVFDGIVSAVMHPTKDNRLHSLCGIAGSGKTTVAEKIATYLRSQGKIVLICAATTLACQNYNSIGGAWTAHRLTKFPVLDDDDRDIEENVKCRSAFCSFLYESLRI
jgi:RecG-like helicase